MLLVVVGITSLVDSVAVGIGLGANPSELYQIAKAPRITRSITETTPELLAPCRNCSGIVCLPMMLSL